MNLKNASLGGILNQNGSPPVDNNISLFSVFSRPDFGDLKEVCGSVPTPFGPVQVEAKRDGKKCVKIPDGLTQE